MSVAFLSDVLAELLVQGHKQIPLARKEKEDFVILRDRHEVNGKLNEQCRESRKREALRIAEFRGEGVPVYGER